MIALLIIADVAVAASGVASVEVRCDESSLGGPEHAALKIVKKGGAYSDGARDLDGRTVGELAAALQLAPQTELQPESLVPSDDELHKAAEEWARSRSAKAPQKKALLTAVADHAKVLDALRAHWRSRWTDDYPSCQVELILDGNRRISARSKAQHAFMIPWEVAGKLTFSPRLGRALAALVPAQFLQHDRLSGERLAQLIVDELGSAIH